jgi:hypothetical protein
MCEVLRSGKGLVISSLMCAGLRALHVQPRGYVPPLQAVSGIVQRGCLLSTRSASPRWTA